MHQLCNTRNGAVSIKLAGLGLFDCNHQEILPDFCSVFTCNPDQVTLSSTTTPSLTCDAYNYFKTKLYIQPTFEPKLGPIFDQIFYTRYTLEPITAPTTNIPTECPATVASY